MIPHNLNLKEVLFRLILSFTVIICGWLLETNYLYPIGVLLTVTGLAVYCPFYEVLGIHRRQEN